MFASIKVASNAGGNKDILLDLPYVDNDAAASPQMHVLFVDNAAANGATIDVYAIQAR